MPSPFPGMDPFLEAPKVFPDLHNNLIVFLQGTLQGMLPTPYFAATGTRVWIEATGRQVEPDVDLFRLGKAPPKPGTKADGVAVLEKTEARPVVIQVPEEEHRETYLDIYATNGAERLVTSIEILSPSNKTKGAKGQKLYRKKQRAMRKNGVNMVEIDLLRSGQHMTAIPEAIARQRAGAYDYHVCVRLGASPEDFHVYPIRLEDRLPKVAIPLVADDPFMTIDLQPIFEKAYENGGYQRRVRYAEPATGPPFLPEKGAWIATLLREKGFLPPPAADARH